MPRRDNFFGTLVVKAYFREQPGNVQAEFFAGVELVVEEDVA